MFLIVTLGHWGFAFVDGLVVFVEDAVEVHEDELVTVIYSWAFVST